MADVVTVSLADHRFAWQDYTVFGGMLMVSTGIGLYYGCRLLRCGAAKNEDNDSPEEFLIANGKLGTLPVGLSMLARYHFLLVSPSSLVH